MSFFLFLMVPFLTFFSQPFDHFSAVPEDNSGNESQFRFRVEEVPDLTDLFYRSSGWFGGDGIFSFALNGKEETQSGGRVMFIFSDTMVGQIEEGKMQPGWSMVNNSVAYLDDNDAEKEDIQFLYNTDDAGNPKAFFIPDTPAAEEGDYYWLGDGFVNCTPDTNIYLFAYRMRNISEKEWGFSDMGNVLIKIPAGSKPPFTDHKQIETPFYFDAEDPSGKGSFGAGIFVNTADAGAINPDGYVYVYGIKGQNKQLLVARVLPQQFEEFSAWRFWDGENWTPDMDASAPVAQNVSNELSVSLLPDGRYGLVYQENGIGNTVVMRAGTTPYGPFGNMVDLWECKEALQKNYITYNAKAHPVLSKKGELIISYNVNAFDFANEIQQQPNLYRPRFIRVIFE